MMAFFKAGMPSAGVYLISPLFNSAVQLRMASMGVLLFGSPPPRWMTGSPFSLSSAAVSFSFRVGDSLIDLASWLRLIPYSFQFRFQGRLQRGVALTLELRVSRGRIGSRAKDGCGLERLTAHWGGLRDVPAFGRRIDTIRHGRLLVGICTIINYRTGKATPT